MAGVDPYLQSTIYARIRAIELQTLPGVRFIDELRIPVLCRVTDDWGRVDKFPNYPDLIISSRLGNIVACTMGVRSFDALLSDPGVLTMEASRGGFSGLESGVSVPFVRADRVWAKSAERGGDAIVAIIDDGLDVCHEAFRNSSGATRVLAVWDQTVDTPGSSPSGFNYGTEHDRSMVQQYLQDFLTQGIEPADLPRRSGRHGTHVASVAAGRASGTFAGGVAPEADLVIVIADTSLDRGFSVAFQDALAYIEAIATSRGRPVVVNVSQGTPLGAHDGTSSAEAAFNAFTHSGTRPGRVIVKSAGNDYGRGRHARLRVAAGSVEHLAFSSPGSTPLGDVIELWMSWQEAFKVQLIHHTGEPTPWLDPWHSAHGHFLDGTQWEMTSLQFHHDNGQGYLMTALRPSPHASTAGQHVLRLHNLRNSASKDIDAWTDWSLSPGLKFMNQRCDICTLTVPGTAESVICVGAVECTVPFLTYLNSSEGPTRDGRHKPDMAAPGVAIDAASAGTAGGTEAMAGTSQAAAHVTGAVALLLSAADKRHRADPQMNLRWPNANQVRSQLAYSAQNGPTGWHSRMGFGVLDVERLLAVI